MFLSLFLFILADGRTVCEVKHLNAVYCPSDEGSDVPVCKLELFVTWEPFWPDVLPDAVSGMTWVPA